jgi:hypothetical protein
MNYPGKWLKCLLIYGWEEVLWFGTSLSYSLEYNVLALRFVSGRLKITRAMKMFIIIKINVSLISQWSRESATAKNNQEVRYLCVINRICCPHRNQCHHNRNRQMKQGKPSACLTNWFIIRLLSFIWRAKSTISLVKSSCTFLSN